MPSKTTTKSTRVTARSTASTDPRPDHGVSLAVTADAPQPHPLSDEELRLLVGDATQVDGASAAAATGPAPTMEPPQAATSGPPASAGTPITGQKVVATYAEQTNRNAWAYLATAGWKKLSDLTDTGSTTMTLLAAHARATGTAPYVDENPAGTIGTLYVW
ncbi:MAG: hypothetical protein L0H79_21085 [Intrasporangium sp.]|uniref:hypothetical protein n=1 Tax=Intrasporangium sp. TaxID=1925024 RepID=UPI0026490F34|nr:hypothetical protein [Intrasporangium sp.]MDN5798222.1 hypothetical protein [Intrasporangium sp.]